MYSILLVDDEILELEMMRDYIRWEEMGIYVAGTAVNGKDALEKIEVIQPDIVLTDVQMPILNGIDLARQVSERFDWMQLVFLTGHDEFKYVKSALNIGAVGYLLKPLDLSEIVSVMEKVKLRCEEVRLKNRSIQAAKVNIFRELIMERSPDRISNLTESFCKLARRQESGSYHLVLCEICCHAEESSAGPEEAVSKLIPLAEQLLAEAHLEGSVVPVREAEVAIFVERDGIHPPEKTVPLDDLYDLYKLALKWASRLKDQLAFPVTLAVNEQPDSLRNTGLLYEQSKRILADQFYAGTGQVIRQPEVRDRLAGELIPLFPEDEWLEAVNQLDQASSETFVHEYADLLIRLRGGHRNVCDWAIRLIDRMEEEILHQTAGGYERSELYHLIYNARTIRQIENLIINKIRQSIERLGERFADKNEKLVHQVCLLIDQTYHEPITINSLSDQVYLSPNYLRSIFKEKKGITIHDYLTKVRLDRAKQLLADGSLKVQDIAQKVGYESTSYFISLFLKNQGVTPNEYRKSL